MANREACELYIEQEIKSGLEKGKKPYSIGKELSAWIEKLFEVNIKPETIEKRAERLRNENPTNVGKKSNHIENQSVATTKSPKLTDAGGKRKGAGRPPTKPKRPKTPKEQIFEDRFEIAFDRFFYEVQNAKFVDHGASGYNNPLYNDHSKDLFQALLYSSSFFSDVQSTPLWSLI